MVDDVLQLLKRRAYIFTCSYRTTWNNFLTNDERQGLTYEEVYNAQKNLLVSNDQEV